MPRYKLKSTGGDWKVWVYSKSNRERDVIAAIAGEAKKRLPIKCIDLAGNTNRGLILAGLEEIGTYEKV